jgi:hypothetical protein
MNRNQRRTWWGLYALAPITVGLLAVAARVQVGAVLHKVFYAVIIVAVSALAWLWSETHANLMGAEGVNAQAEEQVLATAGTQDGRFAPSLTGRQAHYRSVMLSGRIDPAQGDSEALPSFDTIRHFRDDDA